MKFEDLVTWYKELYPDRKFYNGLAKESVRDIPSNCFVVYESSEVLGYLVGDRIHRVATNAQLRVGGLAQVEYTPMLYSTSEMYYYKGQVLDLIEQLDNYEMIRRANELKDGFNGIAG